MTASTAANSAKSADLAVMPLVLMYHSVAPYDEDPHEVTLTPHRFEQHMHWLHRRKLRGVSMTELLRAKAQGQGRGLVGLTFDDGYQDFLTYAIPTLQKFGFTATTFVLAGRLGGEDEWNRPAPVKTLMTKDEVRRVAAAGMEIGSHGLAHVKLTEVDDETLKAEAVHSRAILSELVGSEVTGFCYPFGKIEPRVVNAIKSAGYEYACAIWPSRTIGRHAIPRTYVHDRDTSWRLDAKRLVAGARVGNRFAVRRHRGAS
ncbi:polysaccharide deacetylase family protein [Mycolicibacterium iranicum]|uniref:Polysaccharide deacetylase n=1 Tax=Mycolicibacterium iranicum TaxID=912594 RepID=A0A1X1WVD9_MYCIR|nr:polysaccharide deacetylase family protein [Mycolicibacterium iranicum]ORV90522.1 polysaccharide deacetylase [Mycolicibacterium iranicum]